MAVLRDIIASSIASAAATQGGERRRCSNVLKGRVLKKQPNEIRYEDDARGCTPEGCKKITQNSHKNIYQHCYEVNLVSERLSNDSSDFATIGIY